jgi:aryl sulfotransferase
MIASDFVPPPRRPFAPWVRYASYVPLYGVALPLVKTLEAFGAWPQIMSRRAHRESSPFRDYRPSGGDVFVCAYFKSGTTWTLQIATQIAFRGQAEFANIHHVVPWPDVPMPPMARLMIPLADPSPLARSPTGRRVIKTHLTCAEIPFVPEARYIAVVRNLKDVCVSGYHFLRSMAFGPLMPSVARWVDYLLSPDFRPPWAEHLAGYWAVRHQPNVLFLTYEQMRRDHFGTVRAIAEFMGVDLTLGEVAAVVEQSTFAAMKAAGAKFEPGRVVPWGRERSMLRRGQSGTSSELLTPEQQARIDDWCRAELARLRCDFPYHEAFGN